MNVFNFPQGKHICTVQNQKTTLGGGEEDRTPLSFLPTHCSATVFYRQFMNNFSFSPRSSLLFICWIPQDPLWCQFDKSQRSIWNSFSNTSIYTPLLLQIDTHTKRVCQTEPEFAQDDPLAPLVHRSPSILQSFLRPKYCGSKSTPCSPLTRPPAIYQPSPSQLLL